MQDFDQRNTIHKILGKICRSDLKSFMIKAFGTLHPCQKFIDNWHIDLIAEHLKDIETGKTKRLLINIPPRMLKSFCISVAWPAWILGHDPTKKVIVVSYSQLLSNKHSTDCKAIIESNWFNRYFPKTQIMRGQNQKHKFVTSKHGFRLASSVGGTLTGEGADIIIIDDPISPLQALSTKERTKCINWYEQTLCSRLNDKNNGAIVVVMQRLHQEDLSGHLLKNGIFTHVKLPAVAVENEEVNINRLTYHRKAGDILHQCMYSSHTIETCKRELGSYAFEAQYQQNPVPATGLIIKASWLNKYETVQEMEAIYQSWDTAIKSGELNDYSVCTTWGVMENRIYLLDVFRERLEYPALRSNLINMYSKHGALAVLIEDKASGQQLLQELKDAKINIIKQHPKYDKTTRLMLCSNIFEAGRVYFPKNAAWLAELEQELFSFPYTKYDDQVDSIAQFLIWISTKEYTEPKLRKIRHNTSL